MMFAAREGSIDVIEALIDYGGDVNEAGRDGTSLLHIASVRGHVALLRFLIDRGADPNASGPGYTALHWAAWTPESSTVRDYPEWAVTAGLLTLNQKHDVITMLLDKGARIDEPLVRGLPGFGGGGGGVPRLHGGGSLKGATPFLLAAAVADVDVMRILVTRGANPLATTEDGTTGLMLANGLASDEDYSAVPIERRAVAAELLLDWGSPVAAANAAGTTALHAAAYMGVDAVVDLLLKRGADINAKNRMGISALRVAEGFQPVAGMTMFYHPTTAALLRKLGAAPSSDDLVPRDDAPSIAVQEFDSNKRKPVVR
jgi:hypothetical protein